LVYVNRYVVNNGSFSVDLNEIAGINFTAHANTDFVQKYRNPSI